VREEDRSDDVAGELAQVAVVPGGLDAVEDRRGILVAVPADPEAVAIGLLGAEPRVQALNDQRILPTVEERLEQDRGAGICEPAADAPILAVLPGAASPRWDDAARAARRDHSKRQTTPMRERLSARK